MPLEELRENIINKEEFEGHWNKQERIWGTLKTRENFWKVNFSDQKSFPKSSIFQNCSPRYLGEKGEIFTPAYRVFKH